MWIAVSVVGLLIAGLGACGLARPSTLLGLVTDGQKRLGVWGIAAIRIALAPMLWLAAAGSRAPAYLEVLAVVSLLAGLATPLVGAARLDAILGWWRRRPDGQVQLWSLLVIAFGASLVWASGRV